jgi:competence protein ComEC
MRIPVFWLATAYAAGLALFANVDDSPRVLFLLATLSLLAGGFVLRRRWLRLTLACALAGFLLLGGATIGLAAAAVHARRVDRLIAAGELDLSEAVRLTGWLRRAPEEKPFAVNCEMELESVEAGGRRLQTSGGLRLAHFLPPEAGTPAEPMPELHYGDRVEVLTRVHPPISHGNLGSFDWRGYLANRGIFLEGSLKSPLLLKKLPGRHGNIVLGWIEATRRHLLRRLDALLPPTTHPDHNAVLRAMLLGDRGFLSHRLSESFRLSGAYHVLVISGLHVAVIALFVFWLLRRLRAPEWAATAATIFVLVFYLLLVEDRPPIERAVWMVSLYLLARLFFRRVHLANPLALAALVILFLHPSWLFESSFHFSFGAVLLIAFFAAPWIERTSTPYREALGFLDAADRDDQYRPPRLAQFRHDLRATAELLSGLVFWTKEKERGARLLVTSVIRVGLRVWEFFLLSFAIHLGFVLLTAIYFNRVVWLGLLTNILVVPLVGWIVPLGLAALLLGLLWPALGAVVALPLSALVAALLVVARWFAAWRVSYGVPPPPPWVTLLYLAALVVLALAVTRQRHARWVGLAVAALILLVVTHPFAPQLDAQALEVTVLDVGQGDSLFLAFPNGETWLVDGGRGPVTLPAGYRIGEAVGETVVKPYLRARGLRRLDRIWLTHAHHDHMSGLLAVLDEFAVRSFHRGPSPASPAYQKLLEKVHARGIPVHSHQAGERFRVGEVEVEILWPSSEYQPDPTPANNDSLVLRLCWEETCVLLPGDIEADVEKKLAASQAGLGAALLKVPHHGGRDAASSEFLAAIQPEVAVISVGATNPFGHPYPAVLERLATESRQAYRTDRDGSVTVRVGKDSLRVRSFRQRQRTEPYPNVWAKLTACARKVLCLESN